MSSALKGIFDVAKAIAGEEAAELALRAAGSAVRTRLESSPVGRAVLQRAQEPGATLEMVLVKSLQDCIKEGMRGK